MSLQSMTIGRVYPIEILNESELKRIRVQYDPMARWVAPPTECDAIYSSGQRGWRLGHVKHTLRSHSNRL